MNLIKSWLSSVVDRAQDAADRRLEQAMRCPGCGHGGDLDPVVREEQAEGCDCTDYLCACSAEEP